MKEISETVSVLANEFALSQNPNSRKGGLIGLAACAIALGHQVSMVLLLILKNTEYIYCQFCFINNYYALRHLPAHSGLAKLSTLLAEKIALQIIAMLTQKQLN